MRKKRTEIASFEMAYSRCKNMGCGARIPRRYFFWSSTRFRNLLKKNCHILKVRYWNFREGRCLPTKDPRSPSPKACSYSLYCVPENRGKRLTKIRRIKCDVPHFTFSMGSMPNWEFFSPNTPTVLLLPQNWIVLQSFSWVCEVLNESSSLEVFIPRLS